MIVPLILGSIAKSTILQYRQWIAGGGSATKSRRSYCLRKAYGFAAAFGGIANNNVVCNRGQYIFLGTEVFHSLKINDAAVGVIENITVFTAINEVAAFIINW